MKTEQEQIEAIKQIIDERVETTLGQVQGRHGNIIKTVDTVIIARDIIEAGYGNVSEYKAEIEQLNVKLAKQVRLTRDSNAGRYGAERNMYRFQCRVGRLEIKNSELETENKCQVKEIMKYKAEIEKLKEKCVQQESEIDKLEGAIKETDERCFDCSQVKQAQIDVLRKAKRYCQESGTDYYPFFEKLIDKLIEEEQDAKNNN